MYWYKGKNNIIPLQRLRSHNTEQMSSNFFCKATCKYNNPRMYQTQYVCVHQFNSSFAINVTKEIL